MTIRPKKPLKRSVSPFVPGPVSGDPWADFFAAWRTVYPSSENTITKPQLKTSDDLPQVPWFIRKIAEAPATENADVFELCRFLIGHKFEIEQKNLGESVFRAMKQLFQYKTALFLVQHDDAEACSKLGLAVDHRDVVLFARERDALISQFFAPFTELSPGRLAELLTEWLASEDPDRRLHYLDFLAESKNSTIEHYLLFAHPVLQRALRDKATLRSLLTQLGPAIKKISSPTWAKEVQKALEL